MKMMASVFAAGAAALLVPICLGLAANTQSEQAPIACKLGALDEAQRTRHRALTEQLFGSVRQVRELPDGFALGLPAETGVILATAEWVTLERICCPFLVFEMEVGGDSGTLWLRLTGREGVKEFLKAQFEAKR